jgi:hypothetical protein
MKWYDPLYPILFIALGIVLLLRPAWINKDGEISNFKRRRFKISGWYLIIGGVLVALGYLLKYSHSN